MHTIQGQSGNDMVAQWGLDVARGDQLMLGWRNPATLVKADNGSNSEEKIDFCQDKKISRDGPAYMASGAERTQGFAADPDYWKGEEFAYVGLPGNLKDLKAIKADLGSVCVSEHGNQLVYLHPPQQNHPLSPLHEPLHWRAKRDPKA